MATRGKYIRTEEIKKKMSLSHTGKPHYQSCETKKRIRTGNKGKVRSKETRKNISKAKTGTHRSVETKKKISESMKKHLFVTNGEIENRIYPQDWNNLLRDSIRCRDNYMCQMCGVHQDELTGFIKKLSVHHIDYNKDNLDPNNLITLCPHCHAKTNHNKKYWLEYFTQNYE